MENTQYVRYRPLEERRPDGQFKRLLMDIHTEGHWRGCIQGKLLEDRGGNTVDSRGLDDGGKIVWNMENGFPLMTERDLTCPIPREGKEDWPSIFDQGIGEWAGFANGARTHEEYQEYGCLWWGRWLTEAKCSIFQLEKGDNGIGSYGPALVQAPTHPGEPYFGNPFDQIDAVFDQMRAKPYLLTHMIGTWHFAYCVNNENRRVVVAPCHGDLLRWSINEDEGTISLHHVQRSFDSLVGGVVNIAQYAALLLASAKILGYRAHKLVYTILDPHIYSNQLEQMREVLAREPKPFPKVFLDADIKSIKEMRSNMFRIEEYDPHPYFNIPTPV